METNALQDRILILRIDDSQRLEDFTISPQIAKSKKKVLRKELPKIPTFLSIKSIIFQYEPCILTNFMY